MAESPVVIATQPKSAAFSPGPRQMTMRNESRPMQVKEASNATTSSGPSMDAAAKLNEETKKKYVKDRKVGEGTYAVVYLGHLAANASSLVAIKKIKVMTEYKDGISISAIREIKFLQELSHPNIIALHDVFASKSQNINLVLEYLPLGDLEILIKDTKGISYGTADIKAWMGMLGRAVWFCHENFVLHRDIKPNNLLIAADGEIKLADFGLARGFSDPGRPMTHNVITRWYRPPELLYGARFYGGAVDIWATGLVFAELIIRAPYLPGNSDIHQIEIICEAIGTPLEENWPGVTSLPEYLPPSVRRPPTRVDLWRQRFGTVGDLGVDLLMSTLKLDPRKRCTARGFLEHKWWSADPRPTETRDLPRKGGGVEKAASDLARKGGELPSERKAELSDVSRKLNFG